MENINEYRSCLREAKDDMVLKLRELKRMEIVVAKVEERQKKLQERMDLVSKDLEVANREYWKSFSSVELVKSNWLDSL